MNTVIYEKIDSIEEVTIPLNLMINTKKYQKKLISKAQETEALEKKNK